MSRSPFRFVRDPEQLKEQLFPSSSSAAPAADKMKPLCVLDVQSDAIVSQDFRGDQARNPRNPRENAEMIRTLARVQLRADGLCERGGLRRFQSRLPADLLNPAGLELEMVLPSLTKSRCPLRFQPKLQHFKWRADGAAVGMVTWNCPATAATPPVTPVVHSENRSSP